MKRINNFINSIQEDKKAHLIAAAARASLINNFNWTITDGGIA